MFSLESMLDGLLTTHYLLKGRSLVSLPIEIIAAPNAVARELSATITSRPQRSASNFNHCGDLVIPPVA